MSREKKLGVCLRDLQMSIRNSSSSLNNCQNNPRLFHCKYCDENWHCLSCYEKHKSLGLCKRQVR